MSKEKCSECSSEPYHNHNKNCIKCGGKGIQFFNDGPYWCSTCEESFCDECGSHDLQAYDDGEGYPPNILCKECEHWPQ
jgi:hypothetical protein